MTAVVSMTPSVAIMLVATTGDKGDDCVDDCRDGGSGSVYCDSVFADGGDGFADEESKDPMTDTCDGEFFGFYFVTFASDSVLR
jgi:hypothetical protein